MIHKHFDSCPSTQKYLIAMPRDNTVEDILISCDLQPNGVGQRNNSWDCYTHSLCFSFTAKENSVLNLTSLEMGVQICHFFKSKFDKDLKLKWPNDIINSDGNKVGGIIINKQGDQKPVIGIGLNLYQTDHESLESYEIQAGFIFSKEQKLLSKELLSKEIFSYIINNRLSPPQTIKQWNTLCFHSNLIINIKDGDNEHKGIFIGIGNYGQALIKNEDHITEFYSGTLRINN